MNDFELPFPWKEVSPAASADATEVLGRIGARKDESYRGDITEDSLLEQTAGCRLTYADMTDADVMRDSMMTLPKSARSYYVMGHRWVRIKNMENDVEVMLRLQSRMPESKEIYISAIVVPFQQGREMNGADLRDVPVGAIAAAYTRRELQGTINVNRTFALGDDIKRDPMEKLPKPSGSDRFLALVGRQYDALEESHPGESIARLLAEHNGTKLPNAQRWIATARKRGFLTPVARGQRKR
ncbi:hypothetical protein [Bifidobacterium vansinderenii]|uniref:Uncharacterized protein n=1 Tax=Bifidobacterium vansinderenii TaxID=1984871 RepID=A0A229VZK5_9BIFI|nr:hypothetical protein [Bifidobacterium vansinderenii]OXN00850.1 hypothetical protein Tam10B_0806 [Bifidobacterium vansinderenii]